MSRRAPDAAGAAAPKRPRIPYVPKVTQSALLRTLLRLKENNLLHTDASDRQLRRQIAASSDIDKIDTPYGQLMQAMDVGNAQFVDVVHPAASLFHLATVSAAFAGVMMACADAAGNDPLRLIIYADGLTPGNVFRPNSGRKLLAIANFPDYMLWRSACWPIFAVIRVSIISLVAAGTSGVMRRVLRYFIPAFARGVMITHGGRTVQVNVEFNGFLADLVEHKEISHCKGTSGARCCIDCPNVLRTGTRSEGDIGLECRDRSEFAQVDDALIWDIVDRLAGSITWHHL